MEYFSTLQKKEILEFPPWHGGLRIQLEWFRSLKRSGFNPQPSAVDWRIQHCHNCGLDLIPGLRTSICCGCGLRKRKKKKEILSHDMTWMNFEVIMLSEISQSQKTNMLWFNLYKVYIEIEVEWWLPEADGAGNGEMLLMAIEFQFCNTKNSWRW